MKKAVLCVGHTLVYATSYNDMFDAFRLALKLYHFRDKSDYAYFCILSNRCNIAYLPFGNNSLFKTFHSIDILPGPVSKRLIDIAINNKSTSYPPTIKAIPPITSSNPIL